MKIYPRTNSWLLCFQGDEWFMMEKNVICTCFNCVCASSLLTSIHPMIETQQTCGLFSISFVNMYSYCFRASKFLLNGNGLSLDTNLVIDVDIALKEMSTKDVLCFYNG